MRTFLNLLTTHRPTPNSIFFIMKNTKSKAAPMINHHAMKMYGGIALHILKTALHGGQWSASRFGRCVPVIPQIATGQEAGWDPEQS
jgi:hypothetical protein